MRLCDWQQYMYKEKREGLRRFRSFYFFSRWYDYDHRRLNILAELVYYRLKGRRRLEMKRKWSTAKRSRVGKCSLQSSKTE